MCPFCVRIYIRPLLNLEVITLISSLFFCVQMNDYIAAYHDAVLLFRQVMMNIWNTAFSDIQDIESVSMNYFRNISFKGETLQPSLIML